MSGRTASIAKQPACNLMRQRLGLAVGLATLVPSVAVSVITCAAEIGGTALVLQLLTGWSYRLLAVLSTVAFAAIVWGLAFKWVWGGFGLACLFMLAFLAATAALNVPWHN